MRRYEAMGIEGLRLTFHRGVEELVSKVNEYKFVADISPHSIRLGKQLIKIKQVADKLTAIRSISKVFDQPLLFTKAQQAQEDDLNELWRLGVLAYEKEALRAANLSVKEIIGNYLHNIDRDYVYLWQIQEHAFKSEKKLPNHIYKQIAHTMARLGWQKTSFRVKKSGPPWQGYQRIK